MEDLSMRKASFRRLIALFLTLALLLPVVSTMALAIGEDANADATAPKVDASVAIKEALDGAHKVFESVYTDEVDEYGKTAYGYCGFEVKVTTYVKNKALDAVPSDGTMIAYVINTNTERVGTDSDVKIIESLLERNYVVAVFDYQNDARAKTPDLDWSLQTLRRLCLDPATMTTYLSPSVLPLHKEKSYALPAGYNIEREVEYFNFADSAVVGTLEHIVDIWNGDYGDNSAQDFLSDNGNRVIPWGQKTTEDGTLVFNDANGVRCVKSGDGYVYLADGEGHKAGDAVADASAVVPEYKKLKDGTTYADAEAKTAKIINTKAEDWWDCVQKDGTPIQITLAMDILYPTNPEKDVPVMGLSSSYETRSGDWLNAIRPHMTAFLFAGYAGAMWDHAYTPMARDDHYGYFESSGGQRNTFTLMGWTGIKAQTAAVRRLRYLSDTEGDKYHFDVDRFGVYGHSKGCYVYVLGHPDPLSLEEQDIFESNPTGKTYGAQPWLTYTDGTPISSTVQMVYGSSGSGNLWGSEDFAPMFISQGVNDGALGADSAYHNYSAIAYQYDIPAMDFTMPGVGHTIIYGYSEEFDTDMYHAFVKFAHYWLKDDNADVAYITPIKGSTGVSTTQPITIKFTGPISPSEIEKVQVVNLYNGKVASGRWESAFGNTTWIFTPDALDGGALYCVNVPKSVKAENGKELARDFAITFRTTYESTVSATLGTNRIEKTISTEEGVFVLFDEIDFSLSTTTAIRLTIGDEGINRVKVYAVAHYNEENPASSELGELLTSVNVSGAGAYDADISAYAEMFGTGAPVFYLVPEKTTGTVTLNNYDTDNNTYFGGDKVGYWVEDDNKSVKITASSSYLYSLVLARAYTEEDLGREFTITFRAYPEREGNIAFIPMTAKDAVATPMNDAARYFAFEKDENGKVIQKWHTFSFTYTVTETDIVYDKHGYYFDKLGNGAVYLDDIVVTERVTGVDLAGVELVLHNANRKSDTPIDTITLEGGVDNVISGDTILVSGKDRDHTLGEMSKVYATLSLEDYVAEENVFLQIGVGENANAKLNIYGIADILLAQSFDKENTNYLNAPALDRFGDGVTPEDVFGGAPLSSVLVNGAGKYLADITPYVHYMLASGAMYATVIVVLDEESETKSLDITIPETSGVANPIEGFESYETGTNALGTTTNGKTGAAGGAAITEDEAYLGKKSYSFLVNETYTRVFLSKTLTPENYTTADIGRSFTVSFYIKSDVASSVLFGLANYGGANNDWNGGNSAKLYQNRQITTTTEWQLFTYTFTVDATMVKSTYANDTSDGTGLAPTALTFNGQNGTDKYIYIDELSVVENTTASGALAPITFDFEDGTVGSNYGTVRNGSGSAPVIVDTGAHGGTKALAVTLKASTARWYLNGITIANFADDDLGRLFEVTMYIKTTNEAGSAVLIGLSSSGGANNDWNGGNTAKLHQESAVTLTTEWQKVTMQFTVDETMLQSTYVSDTSDGTGMAPTTLTINGYWGDTKEIVIDDITYKEIDQNAPVEHTYIQNFEGMSGSLSGITVNGLSSWTSKVTLSETENHTPGKGSHQSMSFMSDGASARIYFGGLLRVSNVLTDKDIGASYTVSFYIKPVKSGSFRVMLGAAGEEPTTATNVVEYTMSADDIGKWVRYEYSFTVTEEMVAGNDAYIIMRLSNNSLYFDDLQSVRYVQGTTISLGSASSASVSNKGNLETLTLKNVSTPLGAKISYLVYGARGYEELQRVRLNLGILSNTGENIKVYGLVNATFPENINIENAPALLQSGKVDLTKVYGGAPLAAFQAIEGEAEVDVTEYVRAMGDAPVVFLLATDDSGDTVNLNLDFSTYSFTPDKDYLATSKATVNDGVMTLSGKELTLLNVFGNGEKTIAQDKTYRVAVVGEGETTLSFTNADGTRVRALTYVGEENGKKIYTYTANAIDVANALSRLKITTTGENIVLDEIVISSASTASLAGAPALIYDATEYHGEAMMQANMTLHSSIDFNAYIEDFATLGQLNGKDKETYPTEVIGGKTYRKVSFRNLSADGIALTQTITFTVVLENGVAFDLMREISIGRYAEKVLASGVSAEMRSLVLATVDYLNEATRFFETAERNFETEDVLKMECYTRPEWTMEGKEIVTVPNDLKNILGATVSINNTPGFAVFFRSDYEGEVTLLGKTFTKEQFHEGTIGGKACKFVYVSTPAYALLDTFTITVGEDTLPYNLDTYISRMTEAKSLASALYEYAKTASAYLSAQAN